MRSCEEEKGSVHGAVLYFGDPCYTGHIPCLLLHWYSSWDKCLYCTTLLHHVLYLWLYLTLLRYLWMCLLCLYILEMGWGRMSYS